MKRGVGVGIGVIIAVILIVGSWLLVRNVHFDVLSPSGEIADQQRNLLIFTLCLSALVVIPVYTMLGMFAWRYSEKNPRSAKTYRPDWHKNTILEIFWWGIPIAMIGILSVVTWQTSHALDPYKRLASDQKTVNVQVIALQWKWLFIYPDYGIATVNQLPVPEKAPIHFNITADAPMSAFWIPALGSQIYAMNGMDSQLNLKANHPGNFGGYSTNINGEGYADMKFTVHAMTKEDFASWTKKAAKSPKTFGMAEFHKLAKPGLEHSEQTYKLGDKKLYSEVLDTMMGMGGMDMSGGKM